MPATAPRNKKRSSREKVRSHRARLRRQGLRPVQLWLPDTRTRQFKLEAHAQSLAVAQGDQAWGDQAFIDSVSEWGDD